MADAINSVIVATQTVVAAAAAPAAVCCKGHGIIRMLDAHSGIALNVILGAAFIALIIYAAKVAAYIKDIVFFNKEAYKLNVENSEAARQVKQVEAAVETNAAGSIDRVDFVDRFIRSFANEDTRILMMLFEYDLLKFNVKSLTFKHGFPNGHSRYSSSDIDLKWFKKEHTNRHKVINEVFAKNGIREDGGAPVTIEQLTKAYNDLVVIANLIPLLSENQGQSGVQPGTVNTQDVLKNKRKLIEIYPHTLGVNFPYFKLDWEAFEDAIEIDQKDKERIKNKYTAYEVDDNLLSFFEHMGNYERNGIIKIETIHEMFGYYIDLFWRNEEIRKYLEYQDSSGDYQGFKYIREKCRDYEETLKNGKRV